MKRILIIEDELSIKENLTEILELNDYQVVAISDGAKAVPEALKFQPNLIICDIKMPFCDGWMVFDALKANSSTATIPFIFLSAMINRDTTLRIQSMNVEFLRKPFSQSELLSYVKRLCG